MGSRSEPVLVSPGLVLIPGFVPTFAKLLTRVSKFVLCFLQIPFGCLRSPISIPSGLTSAGPEGNTEVNINFFMLVPPLTLLPTQTISLSNMNHDLRALNVLPHEFRCIAATP